MANDKGPGIVYSGKGTRPASNKPAPPVPGWGGKKK